MLDFETMYRVRSWHESHIAGGPNLLPRFCEVARFITAVCVVLGYLWFALAFPPYSITWARYRLWKKGLHWYEPAIVSGCVIADEDRDALVAGLDAAVLLRRFPGLEARSAVETATCMSCLEHPKGTLYLWFGDSHTAIAIVNGKGCCIQSFKC